MSEDYLEEDEQDSPTQQELEEEVFTNARKRAIELIDSTSSIEDLIVAIGNLRHIAIDLETGEWDGWHE